MPSKKNELNRYKSKKRRANLKSFVSKPVDNSGKKSCRIDRNTVIFISVNDDCEVAKQNYLKVHESYEAIYNAAKSGRQKQIKDK